MHRRPRRRSKRLRAASPIILEPVVEIKILAPGRRSADLTGDLSNKRGQVTRDTGTTAAAAATRQCRSRVLDDYQGRLKSLTEGGSYSISFSYYAPVPAAASATGFPVQDGGARRRLTASEPRKKLTAKTLMPTRHPMGTPNKSLNL